MTVRFTTLLQFSSLPILLSCAFIKQLQATLVDREPQMKFSIQLANDNISITGPTESELFFLLRKEGKLDPYWNTWYQ